MTFLIPVRNVSRFFDNLTKQIEANYSLGDEILLIEDHSTDNTLSLLEAWSRSRSYVIVIQNRGQAGLISALNLGLKSATKEWVARFDADDLYSADRILIQSRSIIEGTVAIFSDYQFISESGFPLGTVPSAIHPLQTSLSLRMGNRTAHPSVIFNRIAALEAGAYRSQDYLAEDLSLWLRMSRLGDLKSSPEVLLKYRLNRSSVTLNSQSSSRKMRNQVLAEIGVNPSDTRNCLSNFDSLIEMYSGNPDGEFRKLLFLRDLQSTIQSENNSVFFSKSKDLQRRYLSGCLTSMPRLLQKVFEKTARDFYRNGIFAFKH